ncbi:protein NRT1/ PTR FAMILY 3.1-like [Jatropha curcas]|uniref:protein NRT1/ PTR FAMILY 3.1-like n=1 Tax=Jatropha curcas TaxID=180498 RepID=UPI00189472EA|nr:protein NRT1/ PTR FAMILY 3.1-like [Jatropha curcas]
MPLQKDNQPILLSYTHVELLQTKAVVDNQRKPRPNSYASHYTIQSSEIDEQAPGIDPYCPTGERTANVFHLLNRVYGRSVTPGRRRRPWGDLVVPTGSDQLPGGSPLIRLAQVIVAAVKKRKIALPDDPTLLYQNRELDASISVNGRLLHTNQFKWLDKAAIVTKDDEQTDSKTLNLWRLATVHRVEELKSIIRMLPVWASGILLITASSHLHSFVIQQARTMDRHLSHSFEIPPASLSIFSILTMMIGLVLYERLFVPFARRFTGNPAGISCLQRMGIGFIVNIIATIISALIESKRKAVAAHHNLLDNPKAIIPISVFWLVPQFCLHGVAEVFMSVGHLEFLYHQSPESMRSTAAALYWITIAMGNYIGTLIVSLVHKYTGQENNWLPDTNLNRGRLDYYYWLVTGVQVINLVYYVICAWLYTYKPLEEAKEEDNEEIRIGYKKSNDKNGGREVELNRNEIVKVV